METLLQTDGNIVTGVNTCLCLTGQYETVCCGSLSGGIMEGHLCQGSEACLAGSGRDHAVSEVDCKTIPRFSWWRSVGSRWFSLLSWT